MLIIKDLVVTKTLDSKEMNSVIGGCDYKPRDCYGYDGYKKEKHYGKDKDYGYDYNKHDKGYDNDYHKKCFGTF